MSETKNIGNVAGGYKATISNPNTSEEAKEHAREVLENLEESSVDLGYQEKHADNVARGHKAALNNPNVSEEAKENSRQALEDLDAA